jgi:monothiol glutaredoxin
VLKTFTRFSNRIVLKTKRKGEVGLGHQKKNSCKIQSSSVEKERIQSIDSVQNLQHQQHMKIKAYLKPQCGWSMGVRAIMSKYDLEYEDIDIINSQENYAEMVAKSGQPLSPCVEIDGIMLADVSGEEVEAYLLKNNLAASSIKEADVPTDRGCSDEEHEKMRQSQSVRFF